MPPPLLSALECAEAFNHTIRALVRDLAEQYREDATIYRAQKRVMIATAADPLFVIREVGPYLYDYRKQIYDMEVDAARVEAFFMENTFDAELRAGVNADKVDLVRYIIPKAKAHARALNAAEKGRYCKIVIDLLDTYVDYLSAGGS